ncbi:Scr1 family TA system antitoxin-like transcriptional regulator [Phytomonospora sp. NPDC050363]|uniref:Scr1 family TA system antitoxin-like transcriptional regulator n=1 Tax=Phytomonospora sp. NPDC050363 TaxID=3155642 RepID=UPI0033FF4A0C
MAITFTRRQLGRRLRRLRGRRGLREVEATGIVGSTRTIRRLEAGQSVSLTFPAIGRLAEYYGAPAELCAELENMFKAADRPWGDRYGESVIKGFPLFIELEYMASELRIFEPNLVTGLLQTEEYARELHRRNEIDAATVQARMEIWERRLGTFWSREPRPVVKVLMGEWALPGLGGADQLARLRSPDAEVRVLSTAGAPHPLLRGPFMILRFPEDTDEPDCVYTEGLEGSRYDEVAETAAIYHRVFEQSFDRGLPIEEF